MNHASGQPLPSPLYDTLLRLAPVNVVLFDDQLRCRYAAPVGDHILGTSPDRLIGRPAAQILPPAANGLGAVLERAAHDAQAWHNAEFRFVDRSRGGELPCCWSIQVNPVAVEGYHGVLVSWSDVLDAADERRRMRDQLRRLRREQHERNVALTYLISDLRNLITPISGYLQVIVRRPAMLAGRTPAQLITANVLPRFDDLLTAIDRLRRPPIYRNGPET